VLSAEWWQQHLKGTIELAARSQTELRAQFERNYQLAAEWFERNSGDVKARSQAAAQQATRLAAGISNKFREIPFEHLPSEIANKFYQGGMRNGVRTSNEAARIYEQVPESVRRSGRDTIKQFLHDKDWSHIRAYANGGSNNASNGIWEHFQNNRSRGGRDMTAAELQQICVKNGCQAFELAAQRVGMGSL